MGAPERSSEERRESQTKTLGDVLDAAKVAPRIPEKDWLALIRSIAGGDQLALHALYAQTHRIVFTLIVRITSNRETAEELTLDVFYDLWRRAATYDPASGSVLGWILNQARSRAIDRLRYEHRKKRVGDPAVHPLPVTPASGPYEAFEAREQAGLLQQALQVLTPQERQAIETAFFSELTYGEAAAKLNEPLGTVKTRIRSGLSKLRRALAGTRGRP